MRHSMWKVGALLLWTLSVRASAEVKVTQIDYKGWSGAYRLTNGTVELVVVPQIGRIMRYGFIDGPNVLWNNPELVGKLVEPEDAAKTWPNFGGDKLWPAPQERWDWPPDPEVDSATLTVKILPNHHLILTGHPSSKHGIRFEREIILANKGTGVTLKNTMLNTSNTDQNWGVWEIFQANNPTMVLMLCNKNGHFPTGYYNFNPDLPPTATVSPSVVTLKRDPKKSYKLGTDAEQDAINALIQGQHFVISAKYEPDENYPDKGCCSEVYSNPDPLDYMEMELLAPVHTLAPGKTTSFVTNWHLKTPE